MTNLNYKTAPTSPGIYIFRDSKNQPLYIGKAVSLRARLKNYFRRGQSSTDLRIDKMLASATKLDWQITDSEIEALILESQLIKKHKPRFNIMLRDDKQYSYVVVTDEEFPKILVTHQPNLGYSDQPIANSKGARKLLAKPYPLNPIGPFTDAGALKTTLRLLRNIFPYCTCKQKHNVPCLNYHIGKCVGYCCLKTTVNFKFPISNFQSMTKFPNFQKEYGKNIKAIIEILSGKKTNLVKKLTNEMNRLAKASQLEQAITLRGQIEKLERVFANAQIIRNSKFEIENSGAENLLKDFQKTLSLKSFPHRIEVYDISNIQGEHAVGVMVVFTAGQPDKSQYRKFRIQRNAGGDPAMLAEVLTRRLAHPEWPMPDLILVDGGKAQLNATRAALRHFDISIYKHIPVVALTKDDKHLGHHIYTKHKNQLVLLKNLPSDVANFLLQLDAEAHRFAINYYRSHHRRASYN